MRMGAPALVPDDGAAILECYPKARVTRTGNAANPHAAGRREIATRQTSPAAPITSDSAASHNDGENDPVDAASGAATSGPAI